MIGPPDGLSSELQTVIKRRHMAVKIIPLKAKNQVKFLHLAHFDAAPNRGSLRYLKLHNCSGWKHDLIHLFPAEIS